MKGIEGKSHAESERLMRRQELNGAQNTAGGFRVKHSEKLTIIKK